MKSSHTTELKPVPALAAYPVLTARWRALPGREGTHLVLENVTDAPTRVHDVSVYGGTIDCDEYRFVRTKLPMPLVTHVGPILGGRERLVLLSERPKDCTISITHTPIVQSRYGGAWDGDRWIVDAESHNHGPPFCRQQVTAKTLLDIC